VISLAVRPRDLKTPYSQTFSRTFALNDSHRIKKQRRVVMMATRLKNSKIRVDACFVLSIAPCVSPMDA